MKKVIAIGLVLLLVLGGCDWIRDKLGTNNSKSSYKHVTERDSVVKLDIYPENDKFDTIKPFERTQFGNLTDGQKSIYITLDNAAYTMQTGYIDVGNCTQRDLWVAYYAMRKDRPEYFWLPTEYSLKTIGENHQVLFAETDSNWLCSRDERVAAEQQIRTIIADYLSKLSGEETEYERELLAHDALCQLVEYDSGALMSPKSDPLAWTVYGAFVDGEAVCEGYAKAMQMLCFVQDINCGVVTGVTTSAHMWNYVKIGTGWYHVDVTANDVSEKGYRAFFNVTTEYISKSYTIDPEVFDITDQELRTGQFNFYIPACHKTEYNYFVQNGTYITKQDELEKTVTNEIINAVKNGQKKVEFGLDPALDFVYGRDDFEELIDIEKCIKNANKKLSNKQKIKSYYYGGISGALGFMISW